MVVWSALHCERCSLFAASVATEDGAAAWHRYMETKPPENPTSHENLDLSDLRDLDGVDLSAVDIPEVDLVIGSPEQKGIK